MRVVNIVGARPQFIKAAPVSKALRAAGHNELLVHTGQHYDYGMSQVFFDELGVPAPAVNLGIGSAAHGRQTGEMLIGIEAVLTAEKPDWTIVYGDTNSTLAGALASVKLGIPLAHVEAGLRAFNRGMPEEHNRVLTDHCANLLLCPTHSAANNLAREGILRSVEVVGDPMYDAVLQFSHIARERSTILRERGLRPKSYLLATVHRACNTDQPKNLRAILDALGRIGEPVIFPVHPRTRRCMEGLRVTGCIKMIDPVGYLDMLVLEENARVILTDSGGIQKEAYFFGVPCITLRSETEWVETVSEGRNVVAGTDTARILAAVARQDWPAGRPPPLFGDGAAAPRIVAAVEAAPAGPG
jgi:UDP-N-acetylglucosamine 2-epimerase